MLLTLTLVDKAAATSLYAGPQAQQTKTAAASPGGDKQKLPEEAKRLTSLPQRDSLTLQTRPEATAVRTADAGPKPAAEQRPQAAKIAAAGAVAPDSVTAPANLAPYQPPGWSDRVVVSTITGTHTDSGLLRSTDTLYIDWAVLNSGDGTTVRFFTKLYVDGVERASWFTDPPLPNNTYTYVEDFALNPLAPGTHTLRLVTDALNNIPESNEFDNEYTRTISVSNAAQPNLTPFQPTGWSDRIVVSTAPGSHLDAGSLSPANTLYIDWAVLNNGSGATSARFFTRLYVDGVERASWFTDPPLSSNTYAFVEDYNLGSLSAGTHTLRLVADTLNNIGESNESDNEYTRTITVGAPNLTPFQPTGWSDRVVVSTGTGTHTDSGSLRTTDTLYVDLAVLNNGSGATGARFFTKLYVDGVEKGSWFTDPPLPTDTYAYVEDFPLGSLGAGTHTLRLVADVLNNIAESNESDNEYTRTISVSNAAQPNLTPFQPTGWSDRIVVSTAPGTHTDSGSPTPSDTLYVDWAVLNNGGAATSARFFTKLYVDGVEKGSWFTDPPLNTNTYTLVEDFPIGRLGAGAHTLRLVTDALSNITEGNEADNEYTRTINVTQAACASLTVNVSPTSAGTIGRTPENCSSLLDLLPAADDAVRPLSDQPAEIHSPDGLNRTAAVSERFRTLINKAEAAGTVRVIVGVRASFQPEGTLGLFAAQSQRRAIAQAQDVLLARLSTFSVRDVRQYETIPFIAMEVDAAALAHMAASADVTSVEEDKLYFPTLAESVALIGAPNAWAAGYSGSGQAVAILDTGVDKTHTFLTGKVVSEACYSTNAPSFSIASLCPGGAAESISSGSGVNCNTSVYGCEHGTHVAGIAAGRGSSFSGVARDANIIAIQVFSRLNDPSKCPPRFNSCTTAFTRDIISGMLRVQALAGTYQIASVNLSLGGDTKFTATCDGDDTAMTAAVNTLHSLGIATIIAAGNEGYTNGLSSPACISKAVSVGSTGDSTSGDGCPFWQQDRVSDFSNSASFLNLLAPGQCIRSSIPGGGYTNLPGTSMAAPHVAGAWAVLKSKFPSAGVDQILSALAGTGVPITDSRNGITTRRIQVDAALNALGGGGGGGGSVLRYSSGNTVTLTANANAGYAFVKWQQDGFDFSTSPTVSVQVNSGAGHTMTAVFRQGSATTINSVTVASPKLVVISGSGFGSSPIVLVDGQERGDYINSASDTTITMRGKLKKMGLKAGTHNVQIIGLNGYSNVYTVTVF